MLCYFPRSKKSLWGSYLVNFGGIVQDNRVGPPTNLDPLAQLHPDEGGGHCLLSWWGASEPREQLHKLLLQQAHRVTFGDSRVGVGAPTLSCNIWS